MRMKKRVLVCAYFAKNVGDDLFLKVLFDRYPHVNWELLTANRDYLDIFKDYENVKITYSYRDIKIGKYHLNLFFLIHKLSFGFKKYDAIVNIGGSIFMQNPTWMVSFSKREYLIKKIKAERNFIIGANFGPFLDQDFMRKHRELFPTYDDICFRDSSSYNLFKDLKNVRLAPDVVLGFQDHQIEKKEKVVGISTINLEDRPDLRKYTTSYNHKIAKLVEHYIEKGYQIRLFSFCEKEGDLKGLHKIINKVSPQYIDNINIIRYTGDLLSFLKVFKSCGRIIGSRFHSLILAMVYDQPFYPLIYSEKTSHFLTDLGFSHKGCHIRDMKHLNVTDISSLESFSHVKDKQVFLDANRHFDKLDAFLGSHGA